MMMSMPDPATPPSPRVLVVAHHYPPHVGGLEIVVQRQARSLAAAGFGVLVLTSATAEAPPGECAEGRLAVIRIACWHVFERIFFIPFPLFSPGLVPAAWRAVRNADVVHIHDVYYMSSWIVALLGAVMGKPLFVTQHVALVEHSSRFVMAIQKLAHASIGRWIFHRARRIVVYNDNVREFLLARGIPAPRIRQLINGIDTEVFRPARDGEKASLRKRFGLPADRPLVLFVGRLVEKKGVRVLLECKTADFDLVMAGPGPIPPGGHAPGIHWTGPVDQHQIALLYRACDLFAFPAVGEIYTLAMQEAMASGLPVVTTDDPAYEGSDVADCIIRCPREPEAFRQAIRALLGDPCRVRTLGTKARSMAKALFDWHTNFSTLAGLYGNEPRAWSHP